MAQLVLLVVAAAWAAVLIPPMLRSRLDNRPNSSVTDFRRQLNRLQGSATPPRGSMRAMGRPLVQSPLQRQAAPGRPGQPLNRPPARSGTLERDRTGETPRRRSHGDPSGGQRRPEQRRPEQRRSQRPDEWSFDYDQGQRQRGERPRQQRPQQRGDEAYRREPAPRRRPSLDERGGRGHHEPHRQLLDQAALVRRRRTNVLFFLVVTSACTMFLAATTDSTAMLWIFGLSFIAMCGYGYMLAQVRDRDQVRNDGWLEHR